MILTRIFHTQASEVNSFSAGHDMHPETDKEIKNKKYPLQSHSESFKIKSRLNTLKKRNFMKFKLVIIVLAVSISLTLVGCTQKTPSAGCARMAKPISKQIASFMPLRLDG